MMQAIRRYWPFAFFVALVLLIGSSAAVFTDTGPWYQSLKKPPFTPPAWVIPVVWTILFVLIGLAGALMYYGPGNKPFFWIYAVNLALNFSWSFLFFTLKSPTVAFVELVFLWMTIVALIGLSWGKSRLAAILLLPYLLWVTFAGVLNLSIATGLFM